MNFRPSGGGHLLFTSISFVRRLLQRYSFLFFGGCSIRDIPIGPLLQQALLELRKDASDDVFIFASRNGTPLDSHNLLGRVLKSASTIASYVYSLDPALHPLTVAERGGRSSGGTNGAVSYSYDAVGNRTQRPQASRELQAGLAPVPKVMLARFGIVPTLSGLRGVVHYTLGSFLDSSRRSTA